MRKLRTTASAEAFDIVLKFSRLLEAKIEANGLKRQVPFPPSLTLATRDPSTLDGCYVQLGYVPAPGLEHELMIPVGTVRGDINDISSEKARRKVADVVLATMQHLRNVSEIATASRIAITRAASAFIDEASKDGVSIELLRVVPNTTLVFDHQTDADRRDRTVFYVHMIMPNEENGVLRDEAFVIDADDADEFSEYLRFRTLPEMRELRSRFQTPPVD